MFGMEKKKKASKKTAKKKAVKAGVSKDSCGSCEYAQDMEQEKRVLCRRYPAAVGKWARDWCGEFK